MKILIVADSPYLYTGLARINREIIKTLCEEGHEVFLGAWGWDQIAFPLNEENKWLYKFQDKEVVAFPLIKEPKKQLLHVYEIMKNIKCDVLLTIGDYFNFNGFHFLKSKLEYSFKWIAYFTIDSPCINDVYKPYFSSIDEILCPSWFGVDVVEKFMDKTCSYVPFGVDSNCFYKFNEEEIETERGKRNLLNKYRFICVAKNQQRKNIPAFMEALKIANMEDNTIVGYLHTNIDKRFDSQFDINYLYKKFNLENILFFPDKKISIDMGCCDEHLNVEYNCSDCMVIPSVAEGFCFPIFEAYSCGLPVVGTDCSAISEFVIDKNFLVEGQRYVSNLEHEVKIINIDKLAEKMIEVKNKCIYSEKYLDYAKGFLWKKMNTKIMEEINNLNMNKLSIPVDVL
jgi:glycosyltransferase involved in cell wall biosynthesis